MSDAPILVTGASGFIGSAVVRALLAKGQRVRVLMREGSDDRNVRGLDVERATGDLCDPMAVRKALRGCRYLYHVAALYSLWSRDTRALYRCNVEGTRTILTCALQESIERVVYTSSVGVLGIPHGSPGNEDTPVTLDAMVGPYKRSKYLAEQEALRIHAEGLPLVIVHPSTPVGARDIKPTPTGKVIVDFMQGKLPAYLDTGLNYVAVTDVAEGHLLAMRHGRDGGRYILGNQDMTLKAFLDLLARLTGRQAPRFQVPYPVAFAAGLASEAASRLTRRPPRAPLVGVQMARKHMYFDPSRARHELGLPQTPVEVALEEAVRWFRDHGYVSARF